MTHIIDVATTIDREALVPISKVAELYHWPEKTERIFQRFFRFRSVCLHNGKSLSAILSMALGKLLERNLELKGGVDYLVYARCLHCIEPFGRSILEEMSLDLLHCRPELISITQGSSASGLLSVKLIHSLMATRPARTILLTGEKCFHPLVQYTNHHGINGEGATAVFLSTHQPSRGTSVLAVAVRTITDVSTRVVQSDIGMRNAYDHSFVATMVATIQEALGISRIAASQIDAILPYHMSPYTFDHVVRALGISPELVVRSNLQEVGHCSTGDAFINLRTWAEEAAPCGAARYLLSMAAGITGTFSAIILKREAATA